VQTSSRRGIETQTSDVLSIVYLPEKEVGTSSSTRNKLGSSEAKLAALGSPYLVEDGQKPRSAEEIQALRQAGHTVCEPVNGFHYRSIEDEEQGAEVGAARKAQREAERKEARRK
jgi:hypothetical protein